jgi:hypothetical protein
LSCPTKERANETGASTLSFVYGTIPVKTADTAIYNTVHTIRDPIIPIGISRCGRFTSSDAVAIASNPR